MITSIDNPGGGNCGYYAFALALIEQIQEQLKTSETSPLFEKWRAKGLPPEISLEQLRNFDFTKMADNYKYYEHDLLATLQLSLRHICWQHQMSQLNTREQVQGSTLFCNFAAMVNRETGDESSLQFNVLAGSKSVKAYATNLRNRIQDIRDPQRRQDLILDALVADLNNPRSSVRKAASTITGLGVWATSRELGILANAFDVNFQIQGFNLGRNDSSKPCVTVVNQGNFHWKTQLQHPIPALGHSRPRYHQGFYSSENYLQLRQEILRLKFDVKADEKIDIETLDLAQAKENESDEDFAKRLQEADIRCHRGGPK